jgi:hypothetical protein
MCICYISFFGYQSGIQCSFLAMIRGIRNATGIDGPGTWLYRFNRTIDTPEGKVLIAHDGDAILI